jgi:two-component system sensor kinase FixL
MALFIVVAGFGGYVSNRKLVETGLEHEAQRDLRLDMARLQASLEEAAISENRSWMQEQIADLGADTHTAFAVLVDASDTVIASTRREYLGKPIGTILPPSLASVPLYQAPQREVIRTTREIAIHSQPAASLVSAANPILLGKAAGQLRPDQIGLLLLTRNYGALKQQAFVGTNQQARRIALLLVSLAIATSLILHFTVSRRLARISTAADALAAGNRTARSRVSGRDEIASLGRSFDSMVDDFRRNEAALRESEERHRSLFQNAVEGVITMGEDRQIRAVNPAAQSMFGYREEELVGKNVNILMPNPYHEQHDRYVANYLKTKQRKIIGLGREVLGKRKDGSEFPIDLSVAELQLSSGRVFTGIVRDITGRKRAELELQRLNEQLEELVQERTRELEDAQEALVRKERLATLGQLAGSVAHEIRNPLGIVRNASYFLEQINQDGDRDTVESFDEIRRGLSRADLIITELLDFARDPKSHPRLFSVREVLKEAFDGVEIPPEVTVNQFASASSISCYGDPSQIARIVNNLLVNAIQAMDENGGALTVRSLVEGSGAVIEVEDTGSGMTPEQLAHIFEPLFTTKTRGIGLGLALSLRYAELNHAQLSAESEPGKGSLFRLVLPQSPPETIPTDRKVEK